MNKLCIVAVALVVPAFATAETETESRSHSVTTVERSTGPAAPDVDVVRDDATLAERVRNLLVLTFGEEDARDIEIDVEDGVVYVAGYVPSEGHRRQLHDIVHGVAGVKGLEIGELRAVTYFEERETSPE